MTVTKSSAQRLADSVRDLLAAARERTVELRRRAAAKSPALALEALVFLALVATAGLAPLWALASFAVVVAATIAGDGSDGEDGERGTGSGDKQKGSSRERDGESWRALVEAIPEAAVALDGSGTVMHLNAHVLEIFPKARAGQPLAHMSRNPALNAAVDRAYASAEPVVVDLYERVKVGTKVVVM